MAAKGDSDPFDELLSLEDKYYNEGYDLGVLDGDRAGLIEGRLFGLEKGFEKYVAMGKLHGRAMVWAGRLSESKRRVDGVVKEQKMKAAASTNQAPSTQDERGTNALIGAGQAASKLPANPRLANHVRTLYALTEPGSLSTENSEFSVSEFDDRLKRAEGKIKILEKLTGETVPVETLRKSSPGEQAIAKTARTDRKGDGGIEDISSLHARH